METASLGATFCSPFHEANRVFNCDRAVADQLENDCTQHAKYRNEVSRYLLFAVVAPSC